LWVWKLQNKISTSEQYSTWHWKKISRT
jgi:hypothetical protein